MAEKEYIELDKPITVTDTRGIEHEITVRHIFEMNKGKYEVADVRSVVLCKDCKHRPARKDGRIIAPKDANGYTDYKCPFVCEDSFYNRMTADDDYCSCGEKREES